MAESRESQIERMLRLCRAQDLPEVTVGTSYGMPALQVRGSSFASVKSEDTMVLHCPVEQKELLMEAAPELYWQTDHYKGWPALLVRLDVIEDEELSLRLADAWSFKAPKSLLAGRS